MPRGRLAYTLKLPVFAFVYLCVYDGESSLFHFVLVKKLRNVYQCWNINRLLSLRDDVYGIYPSNMHKTRKKRQ